jgi:hypothetical protein
VSSIDFGVDAVLCTDESVWLQLTIGNIEMKSIAFRKPSRGCMDPPLLSGIELLHERNRSSQA